MRRSLWIAVTIGAAFSGAAQLLGRPDPWIAQGVHTNQDARPQFDLLADDFFPSLAVREPTEFIMQGAIIPDSRQSGFWFGYYSDTRIANGLRTSTNVPSIDASIVFEQAGVQGVTNAVLMAWRPSLDAAIVTGHRGTNYIAAVAYREIRREGRPWRRLSKMCYMADHRCITFFSNQEYDHQPTLDDAAKLLQTYVRSPQSYIFREVLKE